MIRTEENTPKKKDPTKELYQGLVNEGLFTKDYETFKSHYSNPENLDYLYKGLKEEGLVSVKPETFKNHYFPQASEGKTKKPPQNAQNGSETSPLSDDLEGSNGMISPKSDPESEESGFRQAMEEFGKGIIRGLVDIPKSVATLKSFGGMNPSEVLTARYVQDYLQGINESESLSPDEELQDKKLSDVYKNPGELIPYLAGRVGQAVPSSFPGIGAAKLLQGAGRGAQIAGAALASSPLEVSGQLEDLEGTIELNQSLRDRRSELIELQGEAAKAGDEEAVSEIDKAIKEMSGQIDKTPQKLTPGDQALAVGSGLLSSAVEGVGDVALFKYLQKSLNKSNLDKAAKETAKDEISRKLSDVAINISKQTGKSMGVEAATETIQEVIASAGAKLGWNPDREILSQDLIEAGVVGGLTGGTITGVGSTAGNLSQFANRESQTVEQQLQEIEKERERLESRREQLEQEGEPTQDVDAAIAEIDRVEADILQKDLDQAFEEMDRLGEEAFGTDQGVQESEEFTDREQQEIVNGDPRPTPPHQEFGEQQVEGDTQQGATEPVAVPDNPLPAQVDERYQSWIERDDGGTPSIKVKNAENDSEIDYRSNNRKDIVEDFIRQGSPGLKSAEEILNQQVEELPGQDARQVISESFDNRGNPRPEIVLEQSENPAEIAQAIENRQEDYSSQINSDLHVTLSETQWGSGGNLTTGSLQRWGDYDSIPQNIKAKARNPQKDPGARSADEVADTMTRQLGRDVSPDEVVESFIKYHEDKVGRPNEFNDPVSDHLADKFKQITGQKYNPEFGDRLVRAQAESIASKNQNDVDEISDKARDYIDEDGNFNYNELLQDDELSGFLTNNNPLTQEDLQNVTQQLQQFRQQQEQARQRPQGREREDISEAQQAPESDTESTRQKPVADDGSPPYVTPSEAAQDLFTDGFSDISDSMLDRIRVQLQDRYIDLKRYQEKAEEVSGPLDDIMNAYQEEELFTGQVERHIEEFKDRFEDPILEKINEMGWTIEQAEEYLMARHAPERNEQIASINPEMPDGGSGMLTDEANDIVEEVHQSEVGQQAQELGRLWDEMVEMQREILLDSGLATPETIQAWDNAYDHYISLRGDTEGQTAQSGKGFDLMGRFKRATGRTTRAENAIPNTLAQIRADIVRAQKAEVGKTLLRFVTAYPNPDLWTVDQVEYKPTINSSTGLVERKPDPKYKLADNVLNVKIDGKDHHITFHSERGKRLAKSLKNLGPDNASALLQGLHSITRYLALINTGWNPEFVISNFMRDIQTAAINLSSTEADGLAKKIVGDVLKGRKGMAKYLKGETDTEWARHAENFVETGGKTGWIDAYKDIDTMGKDLNKRLKRLQRKKGDPREIAHNIGDFVQRINDSVENAVRLSAFVHARKIGLTDKQAASLAKNLTVNFNRRGQLGPMLNGLYLFYGASTQGIIRIFQAVKSPKVRKIIGGLFVGATMLDMINRMVGGEDEEDEIPYYDKIPDWVKERNVIIMLPGIDRESLGVMGSFVKDNLDGFEGSYLQIPSPYGYNVVNVAGMEAGKGISHAAMGNPVDYSPAQSALNIGSAFLDSFNPVGQGGSFLQTIAPTIADPFVQTGQNIDWTGQPIKPPQNPFDMSPIPESQQFFGSAPEWAKKTAKEVNELTGGSEVKPGLVDVSPEYLEHWYRYVTGGAGNFLDESTDAVVKAIQGEQIEPHRVPFAGKIYGQVSDYNNYQTYNEYLKKIEYAQADLEDARLKKDKERIKEIREEDDIWLKNVGIAKDVQKEIQSLRKDRNEIEDSDLPFEEKKEKTDRLNKLIGKMQKKLIKRVNDTMRDQDD